jgi:hypothetical protein
MARRVAVDGARLSFIPAQRLTGATNVAVIHAAGPCVAAALPWIYLREHARMRTLRASLVAVWALRSIAGGVATWDVSCICLGSAEPLPSPRRWLPFAVTRKRCGSRLVASLGQRRPSPSPMDILGVTGADVHRR